MTDCEERSTFMNRQLKRIEQTLHSLEKAAATSATFPQTTTPSDTPEHLGQAIPAASEAAPSATVSFHVHRSSDNLPHTVADASQPPSLQLPTGPATPLPTTQPVQPLVIEGEEIPSGEKFKLPTFTGNLGFSRHQNGSNPDLALNLLQETLTLLQGWRVELQQVIRAIQEIYREGPIVDGWLECSTQKVEATTEILRHAEVSHLMGYVESICNDPSAAQPEYRLCGLSDDGRVWSSPCPQSQLASLSLAIARHQKLQPLLQRKLTLEKQLNQAAEITAKVHGQVQAL
ncbi:hypothetical protein IQ266_11875 [filamentous cyanobacterium LEGE 11480]|uniref:Uncharacterized protein n=1 Tax=Romeriopsis navalis LEGE 11480 TaxID=2777977 RepID=A0A928VPW5_9CYAN|nr:hypothetical protein [Romeriopsis navalis]MBE9030430.1 hypothetical protein [Romeriopsis navalis LEGE 11480]